MAVEPYDTYILEPWFVVSDKGDDGRLGVTLRWSNASEDGGHIRLSRQEAAQLNGALVAWLTSGQDG